MPCKNRRVLKLRWMEGNGVRQGAGGAGPAGDKEAPHGNTARRRARHPSPEHGPYETEQHNTSRHHTAIRRRKGTHTMKTSFHTTRAGPQLAAAFAGLLSLSAQAAQSEDVTTASGIG